MEYSLPLPTNATAVENFMHKICDHHGFLNATVSSVNGNLVISYDDEAQSPHQPSSGFKKVVC